MSLPSFKLPSGRTVRPRVIRAILDNTKKYDQALKLVDETEKAAEEALKDSERPRPAGQYRGNKRNTEE